jgi:enoyl-CoA hydratase
MADNFTLESKDGVAVLTFNRPEKLNPLNEETLGELERRLIEVRDNETADVMVFTGAGRSFCAGADITALKGVTDPAERARIFNSVGRGRRRLLARTFDLLSNLEIPTVAAVNGYAVGGGWLLVLCCDLRLAIPEAEFWLPEVELGTPGPERETALLTQHVGPSLAKEIALTCRRFKASELLQMGLLNRIVGREALMGQAMELARNLARMPRGALREAKANVNRAAMGLR